MTRDIVERMLSHQYPHSMRHLQQLIMDAERCQQNHGKKGWFGGDKYQPALERFQNTLGRCMVALVDDSKLANLNDPIAAIEAVNTAMGMFQMAYNNWPDGFSFWRAYHAAYRLHPPQV